LARFVLAVNVSFARRASHHEHAGAHEARPHPANEVRQQTDPRFGANEQILIKDKTRLRGADLTRRVTYNEIAVVEFIVDRILDEFVVSAILCLKAEGVCPMPGLHHFAAGHDFNPTGLRAIATSAWSYTALMVAIGMDAVVRLSL
jgi:hypothetical protein